MNRLLGERNLTDVVVEGQITTCLVDTGAMVTTVNEDFFKQLSSKPILHSLEELNVELTGANGQKIPYLGYAELSLAVPFLADSEFTIPVLVIPTVKDNVSCPILIGTNFIRLCREEAQETADIPVEWEMAFASLADISIGTVKSTNTKPVVVQPMETITLSGYVRKNRHVPTAVTENSRKASAKIGVCPRLVSLSEVESGERVPVRVFNMSAKVLEIKPRSILCDLHEAKAVRNADATTVPKTNARGSEGERKADDEMKTQIKGLSLDDSKIDEHQKAALNDFLSKWKHLFSESISDLGSCTDVKHEINLTTEIPFKDPYRRIPPALFTEVREHLKEMIEADAIRPSKSPYSSNVVIVRKKDGSIRFCVDFRHLNRLTVKDAYAIPRVEDTLHLLAGAKYFTKLDLRSGYWQIELEEEDKQKTAFQVGSLGFYEFNRMPFGLTNAPATFQRVMERCMGDMNLRDCLIYLDDVIIFSSSFEEHLERLQKVFERLEHFDLKLKASKCEFFKEKVIYIGHVVSKDGIETDPAKVEAVKNWPVPKSIKDVRSFLGFTGYYRRFIKGYASIARPLNDLLIGHSGPVKTKKKSKEPIKFVWTEKQQAALTG